MDDKTIVESILKNGQSRLFALVVKKYETMVFAKTLGVTKRTETAKELTQQTFIRAYERLEDWNGRELGPWLSTIACHLALNELEREKRNRTVDISAAQAPDEDYSEEREQRLQQMEQAINLLSDDDQTLLRLHYYKKVKTDELARRTGLSQTNVLVRLHRIRERLRKTLLHEKD